MVLWKILCVKDQKVHAAIQKSERPLMKKLTKKSEPLKQLKLMLTDEEHHTVKLAALLARQGVAEFIKATVLRVATQETSKHLK
jgi:hypothetical protein